MVANEGVHSPPQLSLQAELEDGKTKRKNSSKAVCIL